MTGFTYTDGPPPCLYHAGTAKRAPHGFFGAAGGVSSGVYASLNCGFGSGDDPALVAANRDRAAAVAGLEPGRLAALYQVHGAKAVIAAGGAPADRSLMTRADGMVTTQPGLGLSILTADCLPLLLADDAGRVVGACHAGWRGAAAGIVGATIALMRDQGADRITALIGPTIRQPSYQVGREMRAELLDLVAPALRDRAATCFVADGDDHYRFDLPGLVRHQLESGKVAEILDCGVDTYSAATATGHGADSRGESAAYFSHRRATHAKAPDSGRQISIISLAAQAGAQG